MTVQDTINMLLAIEDKSMPIYIDCSHCGKALEFRKLSEIVLIHTKVGDTSESNPVKPLNKANR